MKVSHFLFFALLNVAFAPAQNILVDATSFTSQQLVEDILIDSGCISNVQVSTPVGGNFADGDQSFGYFNANGSSFPFEKGIVMSTGKLSHVPGPNTTLSDDNAPGWNGDPDLEYALNISNTTNATIIEFDFVPNADNIQFRYLFASEEYQEGDANTCIYSDAFAFLIKPIGGEYTNLALVPGTDTPVLVTTVHTGIPGACPPINETYFNGWNGANVPLNFNGQTKVLTAASPVTVGAPYHIKLVIADESNYRYDSAVFLEGGSFNIAANLGSDRSFISNNPLCHNEIYILDATPQGTMPWGYKWFRNGIQIPGETAAQLSVSIAGVYKVEIDYGNDCVATDEVLIEYSGPISVQNTDLFQCEPYPDGRATFNLFDAEENIIAGNPLLRVYSFHRTFLDAQNNSSPIRNPESYTNIRQNEVVYARSVSDYGCVGVAEIHLKTTANTVSDFLLVNCSNPNTPGFATFNFSDITSELQILFGSNSEVSYHLSYAEAISQENPLPYSFTNTSANRQIIHARISGDLGCLGTAKINLRVINTPEFENARNYYYCQNTFPETITIESGLMGTFTDVEFHWSTGATTSSIEINEAGSYTVSAIRSKTINGEAYSCTATQTITVLPSEIAQASYTLTGTFGNQTLSIMAVGSGNYLYSLDGGPFQQSNIFENLSPGEHSVLVQDTNGCGIASLTVFVLGFPSYFTPNHDGYHDHWSISGQDPEKLQFKSVEIYDRFGKLLCVLSGNNNSWDGTYNGRSMPSSDYWFKALFKDGSMHRGHFTLKR